MCHFPVKSRRAACGGKAQTQNPENKKDMADFSFSNNFPVVNVRSAQSGEEN